VTQKNPSVRTTLHSTHEARNPTEQLPTSLQLSEHYIDSPERFATVLFCAQPV